MDRQPGGQDTDDELGEMNVPMEVDSHGHAEVIGQGFWNDFGDLLDDED